MGKKTLKVEEAFGLLGFFVPMLVYLPFFLRKPRIAARITEVRYER